MLRADARADSRARVIEPRRPADVVGEQRSTSVQNAASSRGGAPRDARARRSRASASRRRTVRRTDRSGRAPGCVRSWRCSCASSRGARRTPRASSRSLMPGAPSTPLATSTPHGPTCAIAAATLSARARRRARTSAGRASRLARERRVERAPPLPPQPRVGASSRIASTASRRARPRARVAAHAASALTIRAPANPSRSSAGDSSPWSWIDVERRAATARSISSARRRSTNTPTAAPLAGARARRDHRRALRREVALRSRPEVEADEVGAGRRDAAASSGSVTPQILTRCTALTRAARSQRRARRRRAHQRLADEHRVAPRRRARATSSAVLIPLSATSTTSGGTAARSARSASCRSGTSEVAVVDADQHARRPRAPRRARPRRGPRPARRARGRGATASSARAASPSERRDDQQHRIGAGRARLGDLVADRSMKSLRSSGRLAARARGRARTSSSPSKNWLSVSTLIAVAPAAAYSRAIAAGSAPGADRPGRRRRALDLRDHAHRRAGGRRARARERPRAGGARAPRSASTARAGARSCAASSARLVARISSRIIARLRARRC